MFKLSKLLYAIVNEILPVPQLVLKQVYEQYDKFIKSDQQYDIIPINLQNKKLQNYYPKFIAECFQMNHLTVSFIKDTESSGGFNFENTNPNNIQINCIDVIMDKDVIQHQLKHYFKYWTAKFTKQNIDQINKFYNLQFETYLTDFCNLFTQIYKRLNRRFNVKLDTIIQKMIINAIENKTNINKFRNLFNGNSQFLCYKKCISILQLYKGIKNNIDNNFIKFCQQNINIDDFKNQQKYQQFFSILKQHVKNNVKNIKQYNIDLLIDNQQLQYLNLCIQKRVVNRKHLDKIINLFLKYNKQDYLINIALAYKLNKQQLDIIKSNLDQLHKNKMEIQLS